MVSWQCWMKPALLPLSGVCAATLRVDRPPTKESATVDKHGRGQGGTRETKGLLDRRPIRDLVIRHIGKEANEIEQLAAGLLAADDVTTAYDHRRRGVCAQLIRPALQAFPEGVIV
jgi:hypothetical protein